jgi:lysophospholipase L1-like esterase
MSNPRRRQLLLALISLVSIGATALVAAAAKPVAAPTPWSWVASWATGVGGAGAGKSTDGFTDETLRMFVHTSVGGTKVRIRLSNRYGKQPLTIGHATVALPFGANGGPADLKPGSVADLTFSGQKSVTIPTGGNAVSDGIEFEVPALQDVAISLYFPVATGPATWHLASRETSYFGKADSTTAASGATLPETRNSWFFLNGLDVWNDNAQGSIAVLGDSITDGFKSTINADKRWTDLLAARLAKEAKNGKAPGVVNLGMAGNRTGLDGTDQGFPELGYNTSARFESDVLAQPGVKALILEIGINDVWLSKDNANNIIARLQQLAAKAHASGLKVYMCTLGPWNGFQQRPDVINYTPELDSVRLTVNSYIRTTTDFDGYIDIDASLRNPADPTKLKPEWDSGDHIHPNDIGNGIMANAVPKDFVLW